MKQVKKIIPHFILGSCMSLLVILNVLYLEHWLDSDMAAEMIFSRLLAREGHVFATPSWYYSTEFRFLYTHLVMGPLFHILDNWHAIRMITNIVSYLLLLISYFYFMKPLSLDRKRVILAGTVLLLPFSETMMLHMQMGNTYMSHVIIVFFCFGMFLRLQKGSGIRGIRRWSILLLYMVLCVICGVSGVRYLLALQCPLVLAAVIYLVRAEDFQDFRRKPSRNGWKAAATSKAAGYVYYSILGLACSVVGYGINVLWVGNQYVFQKYDNTNFIPVYEGGVIWNRLQDCIGSILMLFGYIPDKSVISLRGVVTMAAFVLVGLLVYVTVRVCKNSRGNQHFVVVFLLSAFVLNTFVFLFTASTLVPRYYITVLIFALPAFVIYFEEEKTAFRFDKAVVGMMLAGCLCLSTAKVVFSLVSTDKNENKRQVTAFLLTEGLDFGFATYWNGNIITELSDGMIEMANVGDPEYLDYFTWSSPRCYYEEGYHQGEVSLLLTREEAVEFSQTEVLQRGELIYEDNAYMVYLYGSVEELKGYAARRE